MDLRNTLLVARRQIGTMREDRYVLFLLGLVVSLGIVAVLGARHHAASEAEQRARYRALVERQWAEQPDRHPHRVIHYGFLVFREEAPLAFFDPGVGAYAGTSLFLEGHRQNAASFGDARHSTGMLRFGRLTPAAVLGLLLPLFVVAAGFASVSGERERGTLRLLLAQGATPGQIMGGKVLGVGALALAAALPIGLVTATFAAVGGESQASVIRLLALAAGYVAYLTGWVLLTVWVSSRRASSRAALVQLVAIWVALCVAAPRLGASLAATLHPIPSRAQFTAQVEEAQRGVGDSHNPDDPFFRALRDEYLARYEVASVDELPINWGGVVSREGEEVTSRINEEQQQELLAAHRRQDGVLAWFGLLSPYLAARDLSMAAAGTGAEAVEAFRAQAEAHRYDIIQRLNDMHVHEIRYENDRAQRIARQEWTRFPVFQPSPPSLRRALTDRPQSLAALGLWIVVPLAGLGLGRRRLPRVGVDGSRS
ncbi:MAG: DUF3526 domain-containing protein [Gemmatimonadetes bacterium]|nr:DUF3526 domain-containing protein [Gemmatimonadota bacterium]MYG35512.1 DUF3526 domain-containing protein [Gemmatimonadota bacterium]